MSEIRIVLWLLVVLFVPVQTKAQAFTGGILGGLSVNQIDGDEFAGYDKAGIVFGGWCRTNTDGPFQIQGEIRYFGKGAGNRTNTDQPDQYYRVRLRYVEVPVMFRYSLVSRIPVGLGLSAGYLAEAKEDLTGDGYIDPVRKFRKFELAGQASAGYDFSARVTGEIRFSYSLIPVREHPGGQTFLGNLGQYNNNLSFCILYTMGGRRR
jgi:hypothetical protein